MGAGSPCRCSTEPGTPGAPRGGFRARAGALQVWPRRRFSVDSGPTFLVAVFPVSENVRQLGVCAGGWGLGCG